MRLKHVLRRSYPQISIEFTLIIAKSDAHCASNDQIHEQVSTAPLHRYTFLRALVVWSDNGTFGVKKARTNVSSFVPLDTYNECL